MSASECSKRTNLVGEGVNTPARALSASLNECSFTPYVIRPPPGSRHKRTNLFESRSRIPSSSSPSPFCGCASGPVTPSRSKSRCSGRRFCAHPQSGLVSLTPTLSTSDSIFLLGGFVNVVLFCTIRRVIPVKEVLAGIFTGKVFRKRVDEPQDTTWCIGTMEAGEKDITSDIAVVANDDYFALRQPKFEIVAPPDQPVAVTTTQTAQKVLTLRTEGVVPTDPPAVAFRVSRLTKPLPTAPSVQSEDSEGSRHDTSFSRQSSFRKLPPVPQGPRSAPLLPVSERRESPPPPYRPGSSQHRCSISETVRTHSHIGSYDSVVSDTPLLGGNHPPDKK